MTDDPRPRNEAELVGLIRSIDVAAPAHLHERVAAMTAKDSTRRAPLGLAGVRLRLGAAATALAAGVAALALALSGSGAGGGLSLAEALAVTQRPATLPAPSESVSHRTQLTASVDGISFPYWGERFGWRSEGSREDRVAGRTMRTVFYTDGQGNRVGYAIVAGTPAPSVGGDGGGHVQWRGGVAYRLSHVAGAEVVTWKRDGHLCVVSGHGVDGHTLLALASWHDTRTS